MPATFGPNHRGTRNQLAMNSLTVITRKNSELVDITRDVETFVANSGITSGIAVVFCPHTTAAVTVNENCDPDVVHDMLLWMERSIPRIQHGFLHGEGNSDSHIKAALVGPSVHLIIEKGKLVLGTWQGIFFCEFDGPRNRKVHVRVLGK